MPPVEIRLGTAADRDSVGALVERAYARYIPRIGRRPGPMDDDHVAQLRAQQVHLALERGRLLGLIVLVSQPDHLLIENVAVHPDVQGQGLGLALLEHAEALARQLGLSELRLYTNAAMTENQEFYAKRGYRETARRTDNGFARVFFVKPLAPAASSNDLG
jgi:ribosomal protein S18 acetylase RimI-like enzyme